MDLIKKVELLERALKREKNARKKAESILEDKSSELYKLSEALKNSNQKLSKHLKQTTNQLEGVFTNIIDAYIVIGIEGYIMNMNKAAIKLLGFDNKEENINVFNLLKKEYREYTKEAFKQLYKNGTFSNYKAELITKSGDEKVVQINASLIYNEDGKPIAAQGIARDITNETLLKQELQEQKRQLEIIMDNSPIGISLSKSNAEGLTIANKTLVKLLGYSRDELNNLDPNLITHPDDREWSLKYLEALRNGKLDHYSVEKRYIKKDGAIIWVKTSARAVREKNKKYYYQVATIEDISKEKEALEKLKESQNRLAALIVNLQTGILLEDENRNILLTNERFCKMFGINALPKSMIGQNCSNSAEESKKFFKNPDGFVKRIEKLLEEKNTALNDQLYLEDGRIFERNYIPIYLENEYKGHLWSYTDVTIQKKYKESLKAQKEKYSSIIANMNLGLLENDLDDIIVFCNQSFCEMSGYKKEELIGKKATDLFLTSKSEKFYYDRIENRKKDKGDSYELSVKNKAGKIKHWLISTAPNYDVKGKKIGSIGIHLDISENKVLEKQKEQLLVSLEKQNEQLNEYAHIVSHDLKSPLRNISALLSWTKEDFQDKLGKDSLANLDLMQNKVEKMDLLIGNILKYSSIDNDILIEETIDLNELINAIKDLIYIPDYISISVKNELPHIKADKTRIQQVFQNLIGNAVNYIDKEKGLIEIDYSENKTHYIFSIKDNGIGIAEEHHEKIFKIFNSLGSYEKSTGIGLSIVKKVVQLYKGKVWLESELTKGTTFYFSIKK
ncbi:PAS domain S-box protein [Mesonia aestuariivivens]|uniref:histidine kinase n=1 Tax=Mesonia aestuariivivens TaxID=2796128 RepID=A0ABS6W6R9_9FLAO|nr:PAS domain S-box protein [Mesonia aestuariivivens]MBW2962818.1 PAS domain S-box protein [Mesonia aestuariivivens]